MFISLIKKSFNDIVKNPVITLFLVLYFITISLLFSCISWQKNMIIICTLVVTSFLFIAIFISGWIRVLKEIALKDENADNDKQKSYFPVFLEGIGENVVPSLFGIVIYFIFSVFFAYLAFLISIKIFGNPQELIKEIQAYNNPAESMNYIKSLPADKLIQLYAFPISLMISASCCLFTFLYYFPAIVFNTKSGIFSKAFVALKDNFCFLFKNFFMSLGIYFLLGFIYSVVVVSKAYLPSNAVIDILYILFVIYFLSFAVMLICNYYGKKYSCSNGGDCLGENESVDNAGKED